ncbi:hypothetical protein BC831DRAFT_463018, partial [Entophlyctis helioformis]
MAAKRRTTSLLVAASRFARCRANTIIACFLASMIQLPLSSRCAISRQGWWLRVQHH